MRTSFHHQPEAQHPKSPAIYTPAGRLPHLWSSRPEEFHLQALPDPCVNLSIHTAPDVRPLAHAASGFASSTSSSCRQLASVGRWSRLNNAAPSVQLHYRAFVPTTSCSAPVLRIGTLVLTVLAACDFFLCIGATGSHVPYQSPVELRAASMPDAAWAVSGIPQAGPGGMATPPPALSYTHLLAPETS